ncbi:MAG: amidohydrolase [Bacillota bacterium]|nr:amidohydrolase [Bacillota bacterium]
MNNIKKADMILINGKVFSVLENDSIVRGEAIAVADGTILKVGTNEEIKKMAGDNAQVIDCGGNTILPGMCDAHCHPSGVCGFIEACDMFGIYVSDEISPEDAIEIYMQKLKVYVDQHPEKELIRGAGWVLTNFTGTSGRLPNRHDIDRICSDRPVVLDSFCGHNTWMNTKAIEAAGFDENTPDTETGTIVREENNYPSGMFLDAAANFLAKKSVPGYELTKDEYKTGFLAYQYEFANRYGVTMVTDALAFDDALNAYKELAEEGALTLRLRSVAPLTPEGYAEEITRHVAEKGKFNVGEDFRIDTVKAFEDGPFAMKEPYRDEFCDETGIPRGSNAELLWDNEILTDTAAKAMNTGFAIHIHAMGDAAVEQSAKCIAEAQKRAGIDNTRSVITHLMLVSEEAADTMAEANIIANVQPRWMNRDGDVESVVHMTGPEKGECSYPFRTFTSRGIKYAAGTDFPVTPPPSTMHEIHCWMNRSCFPGSPEYDTWHGRVLGEEEPATLAEAVRGLTWGGAYQMRMEDYTGTIEAGKSADFAVLDRDIESLPKEEIYSVNVSKTIFKGKIVFEMI